jgi:glycosyltransferase involved in cell wall biosynthesis
MIPMVEKIVSQTPVLFDAVDCITLYLTRQKSVTVNPFGKLFIWTELKKMRRFEAKAADHFDRLVISAAPDRDVYPGTTEWRQKIRVVPNGVDLDYFGFKQFEPQRNRLVFCAKLDYFPNEDAALYFSRVVWPQMMARRPELRLEIVGSRPSRDLMNLDGKDGIRVRGFVPDVRPFLGQAWVALCPIRVKAGSQFKILEAMAMGTPVVATPISCSGLDVEPGKHLLVAQTPGGFAEAVEALLDDLELREKLVWAARGFVEAHHNWDRSVEDLLATYQDAKATGRPEEKPLALPTKA